MPGMNSGLSDTNPILVAAFKAALLHQGLIVLVLLLVLGLAWVGVREWLPGGRRTGASSWSAATLGWAGGATEPSGRRLLRIGFGLLWIFDGILQAQPAMAAGLPAQVIEPSAASSPAWVQHVVNWAGTSWSFHPIQAGAAAVWIQLGIGAWLIIGPARLVIQAGGAGQRRLGTGRVGVRRGLRRDLRARPDVPVRRPRCGGVLLRRRTADRAAASALAGRTAAAG